MLDKEFVPYEEALSLKELGFDEPCFGLFIHGNLNLIFTDKQFSDKVISAPLFSQAFRWFREKYDLIYVIVKVESWFFTINGCNTQEGFNTYEEAELACLRKLIEIVNGK